MPPVISKDKQGIQTLFGELIWNRKTVPLLHNFCLTRNKYIWRDDRDMKEICFYANFIKLPFFEIWFHVLIGFF